MLEIARATSRIEIAAAVNADPIIFFICAPLSAEIALHLPSDSRYARRRCAALIGAIAYHRRSRCIGRAWFEELATGRARSLQELAKRDDISWRYIRRHVRRFYVVNELNATVTAFSYDPVTGQIGKVLQTISTEPAGTTDRTARPKSRSILPASSSMPPTAATTASLAIGSIPRQACSR